MTSKASKSRRAKRTASERSPVIYTVGHSTRSFDELVELLRAHGIERLLDVRTVPRSRTNPQFNRDTFGPALRNRRITYRHMKDLGGLRRARPDSVNTGWRNASFRGYADYMQTDAFREALEKLIELADEKTTAIMCAEAVPWRCHRSLIADALIVRGFEVRDIMSPTNAKPRAVNPMAKVQGTRITYPAL
ncbi:MAG TPA: DUF488 domain-containing protein [Woeseiaceae bacterium]|nr:DUF488 domain-containing protein [Woeseiaceae bacterium]